MTNSITELARAVASKYSTPGNHGEPCRDLVEDIATALLTYSNERVESLIKALEEADPLEAPSHAWEDGPDDLLANDVQKYLVKIARNLKTTNVSGKER